ncbi:MAG: 3-deoxy-manno-octulosonate cytidylyltransferase [Pseudohongiellaceae bacterium]
MPFSVIIPARYAATRLPGKPLADICGKPMLQHTYEQARASAAQAVIIATDDSRIQAAAESFGAEVCMTSSSHRSGTERIQEVAARLQLAETDVVVNVQADEPMLPPQAINQVAANLATNSEAGIATLCEPVGSEDEMHDANVVKVVMNEAGYALYFSRATIPWRASVPVKSAKSVTDTRTATAATDNCFRHVGIYAYRVAVLNRFVAWPVAQLETQEKLEQLRALYNGVPIHVAVADSRIPTGVDTDKDLELVRSLMAQKT